MELNLMPRRKIFTLDEARKLLPELKPRLASVQETWSEISPYREEASRLARRIDEGGATISNPNDYLRLSHEMKSQLSYFNELGIKVKDIASGLIDFPSILDGRVVYLCWRMNEETISHWHDLDAGFAGRHPLDPPRRGVNSVDLPPSPAHIDELEGVGGRRKSAVNGELIAMTLMPPPQEKDEFSFHFFRRPN